ncbi:MAG: DUF3047 domain-containing protein [Burkholderiaceae bacterium]
MTQPRNFFARRSKPFLWAALFCLALGGCASTTPSVDSKTLPSAAQTEPEDDSPSTGGGFAGYAPEVSGTAWALQSGRAALRQAQANLAASDLLWELFRSPSKPLTKYEYVRLDGRDAVQAQAQASAGLLRQRFRVEPPELGRLRFSWKVPQTIEGAVVGSADNDDAPVRVVMAFDGDRSKLSSRTALISELSRLLVGEELPYATLAYVWTNKDRPGQVVNSYRTDRVRSIVLESGEQRLNQWLEYERDIRADFIKAFGEPPGALISIAIGTDYDGTQMPIRAWYGPLQVLAPAP